MRNKDMRDKIGSFTSKHSLENTPEHFINDHTAPTQDSADVLVAYLAALEVEYVFGIPGGAIEPLYNALARSERGGGPRPVVARHETGAAFMADGYARNSGKLGVCCSTTGPGATNMITGVASAYENNIPLLVITAQTALNNFGYKAFQESTDTGINTVGMLEHCTGYNTLVSHIDQFEQKLVSAIKTAFNRCCPVHLSIPRDVFKSALPAPAVPNIDIAALCVPSKLVDEAAVEELYRQLSAAKNPVFVLGGQGYHAASIIMQATAIFDAKIVTTPDGKGMVSPYHPAFRGVIGFAGHESAYKTLIDPAVDIVIAIGASFGEWASNGWDKDALLNHRLICVDAPDTEPGCSPVARLQVKGEFYLIFTSLIAKQGAKVNKVVTRLRHKSAPIDQALPFQQKETSVLYETGWLDKKVKPQWLMAELPERFPRNTKYFADTGNSMAWAIHYLHPFDRRVMERRRVEECTGSDVRIGAGRRLGAAGLLQVTIEFASMGWAIGASIGASMANPEQPVVCITGDGSMLMNGQEITVAQQYGLPVVFIILNDSALGMVNHGQRMAGAELIGTALPQVDFAMMAQAMGIKGYSVRRPQDLLDLDISENWLVDGPLLLDVHVDSQQVPPIDMRIKVLENKVG